MTFEQWLQSLTTEQRYDFDSEGRGYPKPKSHMMHLAWNAATAPLLERIAELEAKLSQRVPDGFELVAVKGLGPLVSALERAESKGYIPFAFAEEWDGFDYQNVSAAPAAPEQQEPKPCSLCGADEPFSGACGGGRDNPSALCYRAPNAQQAEAQEPFGFVWLEDGEWQLGTAFNGGPPLNAKAVFTCPQPAQLQALSEEEMDEERDNRSLGGDFISGAQWCQSALAAKNGVNLK